MNAVMWHIEDVENVLWGTQTVRQVQLAKIESAYEQGWQEGFDQALLEVRELFEHLGSARNIWPRRYIGNILLDRRQKLDSAYLMIRQGQTQGFYHGYEAGLWSIATSFGITLFASPQNTADTFSSSFTCANRWFLTKDIINSLSALEIITHIEPLATENASELASFYAGFEASLQHVTQLFKPPPCRWLQDEIERKLKSVSLTPQSTVHPLNETHLIAYQQGFITALQVVATSFGVKIDLAGLRDLPD